MTAIKRRTNQVKKKPSPRKTPCQSQDKLTLKNNSIKELVEYALANGSQGALKYYMSITKMQYAALFPSMEKTGKSFRESLTGLDKEILHMSDLIISNGIREGIAQGVFYKEIYKQVKNRVEAFAKSLGKG